MEAPVIINVALAGDYALNLHALATLLPKQRGFRVVSINRDVRELEHSLAFGGAGEYPAIVLLDINFDLHRAAGFISFLKSRCPAIRLAALGLTRDREAILRLLQLGVDCYIPKNSDPEQLVEVLRKLACNGDCTTPLMEQAVGGPEPAAVGAWPAVTVSERRFFRLAMSEASDDDIRRRMNLCQSTFTQLAAKVYRLFGVRSRDGLVLALYRNRFMIMDDL
jgi:DNA-binding NarL/FixJ family response regulator